RVSSPVLRSQAPPYPHPSVFHIGYVRTNWLSVVLAIKKDNVYAYFWKFVVVKLTGYFQQDGHTAGTVVCPHNGLACMRRVFVSKRPCVPMGSQQHPFFLLRIVRSNNIPQSQYSAVKSFFCKILNGHRGAE